MMLFALAYYFMFVLCEAETLQFKVMSFNVFYRDLGADYRMEGVAKTVANEMPDVFSLQELWSERWGILEKIKSKTGVDYQLANSEPNQMKWWDGKMFWRNDLWEHLKDGVEDLGSTRGLTWAALRSRASGAIVLFYGVHPLCCGNEYEHLKNMEQITRFMVGQKERFGGAAIVFMGDFNETEQGPAMKLLFDGEKDHFNRKWTSPLKFVDSFRAVKGSGANSVTFPGCNCRLDYILSDANGGLVAVDADIHWEAKGVSDHLPLTAVFELQVGDITPITIPTRAPVSACTPSSVCLDNARWAIENPDGIADNGRHGWYNSWDKYVTDVALVEASEEDVALFLFCSGQQHGCDYAPCGRQCGKDTTGKPSVSPSITTTKTPTKAVTEKPIVFTEKPIGSTITPSLKPTKQVTTMQPTSDTNDKCTPSAECLADVRWALDDPNGIKANSRHGWYNKWGQYVIGVSLENASVEDMTLFLFCNGQKHGCDRLPCGRVCGEIAKTATPTVKITSMPSMKPTTPTVKITSMPSLKPSMKFTPSPTLKPSSKESNCEVFEVSKFKVKGAEQVKNRMAITDPCECAVNCQLVVADMGVVQPIVWSLKKSEKGNDLCTCFILKKRVSRIAGKKVKGISDSSMVASHVGKKVIKLSNKLRKSY